MTQEFLQDAVVEDLQDLFKGYRLKNSLGVEREINIFPYDTPIREGDDEAVDQEAPPEPYIVVRVPGGNIQDETAPHVVEVILIACVCDRDKNRQGYRDAMHIINEIMHHYITKRLVGGRYMVQYPFKWVVPDDDTHPYYYAAVSMNIEATAVTMEEPET